MDQVYLRSSKYQLVVSFFHRVLSWLHQIWRLLTERNVSLQENGWRHRSRQLNRHQKIILTRECSVCEWMAGHISLCCHDRTSRAEWQAHTWFGSLSASVIRKTPWTMECWVYVEWPSHNNCPPPVYRVCDWVTSGNNRLLSWLRWRMGHLRDRRWGRERCWASIL